MHIQTFGQPLPAPALVCVPGLLGGAEDFTSMIPAWKDHFHVMVLDPNFQRREQGLSGLTKEDLENMTFTSSAADIADALDKLGIEKAYLIGISLGGKIVFDFAIRTPERLLGAVITDVSPGPFSNSELFQFVDKTVTHAPLHLAWPEMKKYLVESIPDRSMRSLIQSQLYYPDAKPPAIWKTGMANFENMLTRQSINDQYGDLRAVDQTLSAAGSYIHVLKAATLSGISPEDYQRLQEFACVKIHPVGKATHFLHITEKDMITKTVMDMALEKA
jgi:pimeloyl-ACP methyl ester carboxylesterase